MDHGPAFYAALGAGTVLVPALADRLLKGRLADRLRVAIGFFAAASTGLIIVLTGWVLRA